MSRSNPPEGAPDTIDDLLNEARRGIERLTPAEATRAQRDGALLVDIRPEEQRRRDGAIEGAVVIDRNVLEWRLAPSSRWRIDAVADPDRHVVLVCNQGYQSSLAAGTLRRLGLANVGDVIGGFEAWRAAGLPVGVE
jgi:rhodanese-related sulfurtransferase